MHFRFRYANTAGDTGSSYLELTHWLDVSTLERLLALGEAGTVYLCHPFLIHAAQSHRGTMTRFMAQPPLYPAEPLQLQWEYGN